jgi:hypothetical protein
MMRKGLMGSCGIVKPVLFWLWAVEIIIASSSVYGLNPEMGGLWHSIWAIHSLILQCCS